MTTLRNFLDQIHALIEADEARPDDIVCISLADREQGQIGSGCDVSYVATAQDLASGKRFLVIGSKFTLLVMPESPEEN